MTADSGLSRREFLRRGGVVSIGVAAWTVPTILSIRPAAAQTGSQPPGNQPPQPPGNQTQVGGGGAQVAGVRLNAPARAQVADTKLGLALPKTGPALDLSTGVLAAGALIGVGTVLDREAKRRSSKDQEISSEAPLNPDSQA